VPILIRRASVVATVGSLRFFGNNNGAGTTAIDRVTIVADGAQPINVGGGDATWDFWLMTASGNSAGDFPVGANYSWTQGNIWYDRDRFGLGRAYGMSLSAGRPTFGVKNGSDSSRTIRCTTDIRDGDWHHIRFCRRFSDGELFGFVDGALEAQATGPTGTISCPDDDAPNSQAVIGAEKHDADLSGSPSFFGWVSQLRVSNSVRSTSGFTRPSSPYTLDANAMALYNFATGSGDDIIDENSNQSPGVRSVGGSNNGPQWSALNPFS
jgi:hypothetical protein